MDQYFYRMKGFMQNPELLSRVRFMLQDVVELRENGVRTLQTLTIDLVLSSIFKERG